MLKIIKATEPYEDDVLRFTFNPDAPLINNIAEQAVCTCKVKQTVSGCFRTLDGVAAFCTIRSSKPYKAMSLSLALDEA